MFVSPRKSVPPGVVGEVRGSAALNSALKSRKAKAGCRRPVPTWTGFQIMRQMGGSQLASTRIQNLLSSFRTDSAGNILLTGILNVEAFDKINLAIVQSSRPPVSITAVCEMGKLSGYTLAQVIGRFPVEETAHQIQTFDVIGPEFSVVLHGPPNTEVSIQGWVFIR